MAKRIMTVEASGREVRLPAHPAAVGCEENRFRVEQQLTAVPR